MRLDKVSFHNLNSLAGSWCVDFTNPELADAGIFLITGKTGSGKTTLLDAIGIALYARTPRLQRLSDSSNEAMTRNTAECWAAVEFTTAEGRWRSTWSQQRARKKADGRLQTPQMELRRLGSNPSEDESVITGVSRVTKEVERITGMTFDNFTRSMMLAQGQFSRFLQARPSERSELLEDITGTAVYSELSRRAYQMDKEGRQKLDKARAALSGIRLLSEEEQAERKQRLHELGEHAAAATTRRDELDARLAHLRRLKETEEKVAQARREEADAAMADAALADTRGRLDLDGRAARLDGTLSELELAHRSLEKAREEHDALHKALPEKEMAAGRASAEEARCLELKNAAERRLEELLPQLQQAVALDSRLNDATEEVERARREHTRKHQERNRHAQAVRDLETRHARCTEELDTIGAELERTAADSTLEKDMSGLEERYGQLVTLRERVAAAEKRRKAAERKEKKVQKELTSAEQELDGANTELNRVRTAIIKLKDEQAERAGDMTSADVRTLHDAYQAMQLAREAWLHDLEALRDLKAAHEEKSKELAQLCDEEQTLQEESERCRKWVLELHDKVELLRECVNQRKVIASLEQHRARLRPGDPCPCCGATEHPWSGGAPLFDQREEELRCADKELSEAEKKEKRLIKKLSRTSGLAAGARSALADSEKRLNAAKGKEIASRRACAGERGLVAGRAVYAHAASRAVKDFLIDLKALLDAADDCDDTAIMAERLAVSGPQAADCRDIVADLLSTLDDLDKKIQTASVEEQQKEKQRLSCQSQVEKKGVLLHAAREELDRDTADLTCVRDELVTATTAFAQALTPFGLAHLADDGSVLKVLRERNAARAALEQRNKTLVAENDALVAEGKALAAAGAQIDAACVAAVGELEARQNDCAVLAAERATLLGGRETNVVDREARDAVRRTARALDDARFERERSNGELDRHKSALTAAGERLRQAEGVLADVSTKAGRQCLEQGFADPAAARAARMPEDVRARLVASCTAATERLTRARAILAGAEEEAAALSNTPGEMLPQEELERLRADVDTQLAEMQREAGAIERELEYDTGERQRHAEHMQLCNKLANEYEGWNKLCHIIGSSDGKKFRVFAQAMTFARLVEQANRELSILSDRYQLVQNRDEPLELMVIDNCMGQDMRTIKNLSGGETFQVSLALALGLASFNSRKNALQTMFLDEGFGTLDPEALDKAVDTLASLRIRKDTALIGIISHVETLEERIAVQLHLHRGGDGLSVLEGPGCSRK